MANKLTDFHQGRLVSELQSERALPMQESLVHDQFESSQKIELKSNFDLPLLKNFPDV